MVKAGAGFEVEDGEFDDGVAAMKGVEGDSIAVEIGQQPWRQSGHRRYWAVAVSRVRRTISRRVTRRRPVPVL